MVTSIISTTELGAIVVDESEYEEKNVNLQKIARNHLMV
jgi:hypothetical protein